MSLLSRVAAWIKGLFVQAHDRSQHQPTEAVPSVLFPTIMSVERPPRNQDIEAGQFFFVASCGKPKWSLFKCPCGCGDVITLTLLSIHQPHWCLTPTSADRPTLYPSVWRDRGCMSHFWLRDGRVYWCNDTGSAPRLN